MIWCDGVLILTMNQYLSMKWDYMKKVLLLTAYCIPFAFLAVNGDAVSGTMLFYGIMVAGLSLLCWGTLKTEHVSIVYIGNILSFISSYLVARLSGLDPTGDYFKPLTVYSLIAIISIVSLIIHTIVVLIYVKGK